ncbi:MAG: hypothetical protein M3276_08000 [Actinomycetota bacterium]|nr:hypothetical protein [Actinomycetota bacterium]
MSAADERQRRHPLRRPIVATLFIAVLTLGFGAWWTYGLDRGAQQMGGQAMSPDAPRVPPVFAYYDGRPIAFIHTEASDPVVAGTLTAMMGSPVPVVASLATVPDDALGMVYVFANGVVPEDTPAGPLGFQPDVFDSAPGDPGYTPLRRIVRVTWTGAAQAELVTTVEAIEAAEAAGRLRLEPTPVVVVAPLLTWPGGQR